MNLNHINLVVANVITTTRFFEKYFGFKCVETKGNDVVAVLKGADGFTLVIMESKDGEPQYPQAFHIGSMQENKEQVHHIHAQLKHDGFEVGAVPKNIRDSFGFYFTFDGIMIEVGCYLT